MAHNEPKAKQIMSPAAREFMKAVKAVNDDAAWGDAPMAYRNSWLAQIAALIISGTYSS